MYTGVTKESRAWVLHGLSDDERAQIQHSNHTEIWLNASGNPPPIIPPLPTQETTMIFMKHTCKDEIRFSLATWTMILIFPKC